MLKKTEKRIVASIEKAPPGKLRCATKGNSFQYYNGTTYLGKDKAKFISEIANREYLEKLLPLIKRKIKKLEDCRRCLNYDFSEDEAVYLGLHPARKKWVDPIIRIREIYIEEWANTPYEKWEISDECAKGNFFTVKGERVRSKSEKIIADELTRYGIPYRYEYPLQLKDGNRIIIKRPDFIALNPNTLEETIIEHLGMMDSEKYYNGSLNKINLYEKNGYLIGDNLLLFHESSDAPLNTQITDRYIENFLL